MPTVTHTTWTCSRCGATADCALASTPPAWRLVLIEQYGSGTARDYTGDLCGDCRTALIHFLEALSSEDR